MCRKKIQLPVLDDKKIAEKLDVNLGANYSKHFQEYFNRIMKQPDQFKSSDLMDVMQMVHAYEADLFRCDKHMADRYKTFEPFKGKLVKSFAYLPERVEEVWNKRSRI